MFSNIHGPTKYFRPEFDIQYAMHLSIWLYIHLGLFIIFVCLGAFSLASLGVNSIFRFVEQQWISVKPTSIYKSHAATDTATHKVQVHVNAMIMTLILWIFLHICLQIPIKEEEKHKADEQKNREAAKNQQQQQ